MANVPAIQSTVDSFHCGRDLILSGTIHTSTQRVLHSKSLATPAKKVEGTA